MHRPTLLSLVAGAALLAVPFSAHADPRPEEARAQAQEAFASLQQEHPSARALWQVGLTGPSQVLRLRAGTEGATAEARARSFLARHEGLFGLVAEDLRFVGTSEAAGRVQVRFEQVHGGLVVHQRGLTVTLDEQGRVRSLANNTFPVASVRSATRSLEDARALALAQVSGADDLRVPEAARLKKVIVAGPDGAFEAVPVPVAREGGSFDLVEVLVDAHDGSIRGTRRLIRN